MSKKDNIITILFYVLLVITAIWDFFVRSGGKILRILLIAVVLLLIYYIYKKSFLKKYNFLYKITLFFVFISMYLANVFDFYSYKNYDKYLHFFSGVILAIIGLVIYNYLSNNSLDNGMKKVTVIIFPMIFAIACAGLWEIWEFTTDQIFGLTAQCNDLHDTMWDIICGTAGGLVSCFFIWLFLLSGKEIKIVKKILEEKNRKSLR